MRHQDFLKNYVLPYCVKDDKPANRQIYNDAKDSAYRDGLITEKQAETWIYPKTKLFE